jgi:hypothetical protein
MQFKKITYFQVREDQMRLNSECTPTLMYELNIFFNSRVYCMPEKNIIEFFLAQRSSSKIISFGVRKRCNLFNKQ